MPERDSTRIQKTGTTKPHRIEQEWKNMKISVQKATEKTIPTNDRQTNERWFDVEGRN